MSDSESGDSRTGLIVTVVIFCLIFAWIITFSILALALKKPIFHKLSLIGPIGQLMYKVVYKGQTARGELYHQLAKHSKGNLQHVSPQQNVVDAYAGVVPETPI